jgi:hypothetical protein
MSRRLCLFEELLEEIMFDAVIAALLECPELDWGDVDDILNKYWDISVTYEIWSHDDVDLGDTDRRGVVLEGEDMNLCEIRAAAESLEESEWSASEPRPGSWFGGLYCTDYRNGDREYRSIHLGDVSELEFKVLSGVINGKTPFEIFID